MSTRYGFAPNAFAREGGRSVKSLLSASKLAALLGIGALFLEALFRVNLSKHLWLVAVQAAVALLVVFCLARERFRRRSDSIGPTVQPAESRSEPQLHAHESLIQRGAFYFQMANSAEFMLALMLFIRLIVLTGLNVVRQTVNSDEPQHLHTIWGWTRGFVQYRDFFDNHMPLFHILLAPIFVAIGERATRSRTEYAVG
jgi:hypothetical protein